MNAQTLLAGPAAWSVDRRDVARLLPDQMADALDYLARRGQTDPGAVRWSFSVIDLGPGPGGEARVNLRLIGVAGEERVSVYLPPTLWPLIPVGRNNA